MTKRDLFRILIKVFGLYSASLAIFSIFPMYMGHLLMEFDWFTILFSLGVVVLMLGLLIALIFWADKIVNLLKLDQGFDEERIDFGNITEETILKLSCILIGGFLIVGNIPEFIGHCYLAFEGRVTEYNSGVFDLPDYQQVDYFQFAICAISMVIGYLLITNYSAVARWLAKADRKNTAAERNLNPQEEQELS